LKVEGKILPPRCLLAKKTCQKTVYKFNLFNLDPGGGGGTGYTENMRTSASSLQELLI
jgi:hypothetical protein